MMEPVWIPRCYVTKVVEKGLMDADSASRLDDKGCLI
eukprot:UN16415